jgi:ribosomal protein L28
MPGKSFVAGLLAREYNNKSMKQCQICSKGSVIRGKRVKLRGNYNPTGTSRRYPNLQKTRLADGTRVVACTSCMKKTAKAGK